MRLRGNRSIARVLRAFADESERGTLLNFAGRYDQGEDFLGVGVFSDLLDPQALNLPGEVRLISLSRAERAFAERQLDAAAERKLLEGVVPERGAPEDEDTGVQIVRKPEI